MVFVSANTFVQPEGEIAVTISNSNQDKFDFRSNWMDYRELTIMYFDSKGALRSNPAVEKPIVFCFSFEKEQGVQKQPDKLHLSELIFWEFDQENEVWEAISTNIPEEKDDVVCGKSSQVTKYVLAAGSPAR